MGAAIGDEYCSPVARVVAVVAAAIIAGGCAAPTLRLGHAPGGGSSTSVPPGFTPFVSTAQGFRLALAPGWTAGAGDHQGTSFSDPGRTGSLLVHFESRPADGVDAAGDIVVAELTGGKPADQAGPSRRSSLSGLPARRLSVAFDAAGQAQKMELTVALEGQRAWAVALAAPAGAHDADLADYERMIATFHLLDRRPAPPARAVPGMQAPPFQLRGPSGEVSLDRVQGPVIVNFFATWCAACRSEMPMLARASAGRGVTVVGVDTHDDPGSVPAFLTDVGIGYRVGYDPDGTVADSYQLPGVPGTCFLDARHVLRRTVLGPLSAADLDAGIKDVTA
jgi:cytochrome c biogenesis protein CcmG/thiol:disulfide interchange protein DsbE